MTCHPYKEKLSSLTCHFYSNIIIIVIIDTIHLKKGFMGAN